MIKGNRTETRNEMYLKYKKSNIFNSNTVSCSTNPNSLKNNNHKELNKTFKPKYIEHNAREQYIKQFWQKDPKEVLIQQNNKPNQFTKGSQFKKGKTLNAHDIMCRDMYSNCNPKEYQLRKSKSSYFKRSKIQLQDSKYIVDMNSKERLADSLQSNIFNIINEENNISTQESIPSQIKIPYTPKKITIYPQEDTKKTNKAIISHSNFTSHYDWKYTNTELVKAKIPLNNNKSNCNDKKTVLHNKKKLDKLPDSMLQSINTHQRVNYSNLNSVRYDIITNEIEPKRNIIASQSNNNNKGLSNQKGLTTQVIEEYQLDLSKGFDSINLKEIKNMFLLEGLHLFQFEAKGNSVANISGKIHFRIRKQENDTNYIAKIKNIEKKISEKQMSLNKLTKSSIRPITELISVKENILTGFKDKTLEKRLTRSQTQKISVNQLSLPSNIHTCKNPPLKSLRKKVSNIPSNTKYKNLILFEKTKEKKKA